MIELGERVRDSATGFTGTITGRCEYLGGEISIQVTALIEDRPYFEWFPVARLEKVERPDTGF